ncbi:respiratory nitrate reductase 2 subunit beta [Escherichia coli]|uniref:Respiratory nitrate reductase 2 subunit beta n=1 Tax=Escherichia coli TaxID=562 RepID=A0A376W328_ECOLX|nr:respiratory nitrate reductase 2 subunit beta [Escherichia coli]
MAGVCALAVAHTKKSTSTGKAASQKNVYFVIRELSPVNRPCAPKPAWVASGIWACWLYDADRIEEAASTEREVDLYERQCEVFLDPHDPSVIEEALKQGIPQNVIDAAQRSPVYKMAMDWKLALPLHPEYRTLPMVWYVPPLSPIQSYADAGGLPKSEGMLPAIESLRIPVQYLANMLSAGDTGPVLRALKRMMAMRHYMRSQTVKALLILVPSTK